MDVTSQLLIDSDENDDLTDEQDATLTECINTVYWSIFARMLVMEVISLGL